MLWVLGLIIIFFCGTTSGYYVAKVENYQICGENEKFKLCGSACPATCSQPEPDACIPICRMGCFCQSGYYRDESTNKCVKRGQCSNITSCECHISTSKK